MDLRLKNYQRSQSAMLENSVHSVMTDLPHKADDWPGPVPRERRAWRRRVSHFFKTRTHPPTHHPPAQSIFTIYYFFKII